MRRDYLHPRDPGYDLKEVPSSRWLKTLSHTLIVNILPLVKLSCQDMSLGELEILGRMLV